MKRMIMTLVAVWMMITSMNAQRLTNIQAEARFITDKMVVELGLSSAAQQHPEHQSQLSQWHPKLSRHRCLRLALPQQAAQAHDDRQTMEEIQGLLLFLSPYRLAESCVCSPYLHQVSKA